MSKLAVDVEQHTFCLESLANPLRLDIIRLLDDNGAMNVTQLAEETGAERSRVSHALGILKQCKFVTATKEGREMKYAIDLKSPVFKTRKGNIFDMIEEHARVSCPSCAKFQQRSKENR
jgi:DNA-binding transcriptional ArsR family regulator